MKRGTSTSSRTTKAMLLVIGTMLLLLGTSSTTLADAAAAAAADIVVNVPSPVVVSVPSPPSTNNAIISSININKHPNDFTQEDVTQFLKSTFGTSERGTKILKTFEENDALDDGSLLISLTEDDLTHDLGMTKLQARKFKSALDKLVLLQVVGDDHDADADADNNKNTSSTDADADADKAKETNAATSAKDEKNSNEEKPVDETENLSSKSDAAIIIATPKKDDDKKDTTPELNTTANDQEIDAVSETGAIASNNKLELNCTKFCTKQNENKKYRHLPPGMTGRDFAQAVHQWSKYPASSPYGPVIGCWDVSRVTDFSGAFENIKFFDDDLRCWNTSQVTNMDRMFAGCTKFDGPLDTWIVSKVTSMQGMFDSATNFNRPIEEWDVANVKSMGAMFFNAKHFNQPLEKWNVNKVQSMAYMFAAASDFNQPLQEWDVLDVEDSESMFDYAIKFNQPLGKWHIGNTKNMNRMFNGARAFNQDLCDWTQYKSAKKIKEAAASEKANEFKAAGGRRGRRKAKRFDNDNDDGKNTIKAYNKNAMDMFEGTSCPEREKNDPTFTSNWCRKCA